MINLKYRQLLRSAAAIAASLLLLQACKKDTVSTDDGADNRIGNIIADNFNLSLFSAALNYTGAINEVNSSKTLTVLAPDDPSFNAAGYYTATSVQQQANKALFTQTIRYHILAGKYDFNTLPFLFNQEVKTIDGLSMYVTRWVKGADTSLTVNGTQIVSKNLPGSNGLIQVINAVLTPSTYPLVTQAIANTDTLTFFNQALIRANLISTLQGAGPYTIFAPTNGAFKAAGYPTLESINNADPATLAALLKYQILAGRKFVYDYVLSTDDTNISQQAMLDGNNITVNLTQDYYTLKYTGITVQGVGNPSPANLLQQNILTGNAVMHIIDQVLKPNF